MVDERNGSYNLGLDAIVQLFHVTGRHAGPADMLAWPLLRPFMRLSYGFIANNRRSFWPVPPYRRCLGCEVRITPFWHTLFFVVTIGVALLGMLLYGATLPIVLPALSPLEGAWRCAASVELAWLSSLLVLLGIVNLLKRGPNAAIISAIETLRQSLLLVDVGSIGVLVLALVNVVLAALRANTVVAIALNSVLLVGISLYMLLVGWRRFWVTGLPRWFAFVWFSTFFGALLIIVVWLWPI